MPVGSGTPKVLGVPPIQRVWVARSKEEPADPSDTLHHGDGKAAERDAARRPCVGDAAFDAVDWLFWGAYEPDEWKAATKLSLPPSDSIPIACGRGAARSRRCSPPTGPHARHRPRSWTRSSTSRPSRRADEDPLLHLPRDHAPMRRVAVLEILT